jgi:hypothetical protein
MQSSRVALCTSLGNHQNKINGRNRTDIHAYFSDADRCGGHCGDSPERRKKKNEMPDYFVFVAWAYRLLLDWSLCRRQR